MADSLVLKALQRGLSGGIFRLGRITGSSGSGIGATQDLFVLMLRGCQQLGAYPNFKFPVDLTPVDQVCKAIVNMINRPGTSRRSSPFIVHMINAQTISFDEQFRLLNQFGLSADKLEELPYAQWCDRLEHQISNQLIEGKEYNSLLPLLPFLRSPFWQSVDRWPNFARTLHDEALIDIDPISLFQRYCTVWQHLRLFDVLPMSNDGMQK